MTLRLITLAAVRATVFFAALAGTIASDVDAQSRDCMRNLQGDTVCPPARTQCVSERDNPNIKCSPPDGGILLDRYGKAVCGVGSCVPGIHGDVFCSRVAGGAAAINMQSEPVCTNGCAPAAAALCTTLSK